MFVCEKCIQTDCDCIRSHNDDYAIVLGLSLYTSNDSRTDIR